uniref:Metalloendopeptidase n=1 Tax=Rhabditophanes sp. KR3021 TaxID=114890 RepID=A0AC35U049_9BILA
MLLPSIQANGPGLLIISNVYIIVLVLLSTTFSTSNAQFESLFSNMWGSALNPAPTPTGAAAKGFATPVSSSNPGSSIAKLIGMFAPDAKSPVGGADPMSQLFSFGQTIANNLPPDAFNVKKVPSPMPSSKENNIGIDLSQMQHPPKPRSIPSIKQSADKTARVPRNKPPRNPKKKRNNRRRTKKPKRKSTTTAPPITSPTTTTPQPPNRLMFDAPSFRIPQPLFEPSALEKWAARRNEQFRAKKATANAQRDSPNFSFARDPPPGPSNGFGRIVNNFGKNFNSFINEMQSYSKTADFSSISPKVLVPPPAQPFNPVMPLGNVNPITIAPPIVQALPDTNPLSTKNLMFGFLKAMSRDPTAVVMPMTRMNDGTEQGVNRPIVDKLFESDIVLTNQQARAIVLAEAERRDPNLKRRHKRKVIIGSVYRWNKGKPISYMFHNKWADDNKWKKLIRKGLDLWESETCLRFKEGGSDKDKIVFMRGGGCYSSVGRVGGSQTVSIGHGCDDQGIVSHEVGHALGFWHEQSRYDRDDYIKLNKKFIARGTDGNFALRSELEIESMGLGYDLGSVMHYGPNAFTTDWDEITIITKDKNYQHTIGQRMRPSFIDVKQINRLYCLDQCSIQQNICKHGGYRDPNNCEVCKCPDGLGGNHCEKAEITSDNSATCGGELTAIPNLWNQLTYKGKDRCVWRITTNNARIRFILDTSEYTCQTTCKAFVEFKHNSNFQQTGFRACCQDKHKGIQVVSDQAEVIIIHDGRQNMYTDGKFAIRYIQDEGKPLPPPPPPIAPWVPGKENRHFRGIDNSKTGIIEKFILNAIPQIRDPARPAESMFSIFTDYVASSLLGQSRDGK